MILGHFYTRVYFMQNFMVVEGGGEIKKLGAGVKMQMIEGKKREKCIKTK